MVLTTTLSLLLWLAPAGPPAPAEGARPTPLTPSPPVAGEAVTPQPEVLTLSLPQALRLGLERDRQVRIGKLDAMSARASVTQAWAVIQPQIDLSADAAKFDSARTGYATGAAGATESHSISVRVEQLFFDTAQSIYAIYRTRQDAKAAQYRELDTQLSAAQRIATDFYAVLRTAALERLAEQVLAQSQREQELAQARLTAGTGARLDVTRSAVAVSNARVELTGAANNRREALSQLRYDLLLPPDTPLTVSDAYPVPPVEVGLAEALQAAAAERPGSAAALATARGRRHALTAARLRRWVTLSINGSFEKFMESSRDVTQEYQLSAALTIPLWDGQAGEASETAAIAAYERAKELYHQELEEAALAVEQAHLAWTSASENLLASEEAVRLATDSLQQTEESFRLGIASLLELNASRTEYSRAEANRIQARVDRDLASINLRVAVGRFPLPPETPQENAGE